MENRTRPCVANGTLAEATFTGMVKAAGRAIQYPRGCPSGGQASESHGAAPQPAYFCAVAAWKNPPIPALMRVGKARRDAARCP